MKIELPIVLACLALLSGCSTLSEQECRSADWYQLGIKDGQQGEPANLLDEHKESCTHYGVQPDESKYLAGREAGLKQYCQPENAFRTGMNGEEYKGVCPLDRDVTFRRNNAAALEVYNSKNKIADIDRKRDRLRSDLHYQERELDRLMDDAKYRSEQR